MGLKRKVAGGVTALTVGTLPFLGDVGLAGAADGSDTYRFFSHTFTHENGDQVTCDFSAGVSLFRPTGRDEYFAFASTSVFTFEDEARCRGFLFVGLSFRDGAGVERNPNATAFGDEVTVGADNVGNNVTANHFVSFAECIDNCEISWTTISPK